MDTWSLLCSLCLPLHVYSCSLETSCVPQHSISSLGGWKVFPCLVNPRFVDLLLFTVDKSIHFSRYVDLVLFLNTRTTVFHPSSRPHLVFPSPFLSRPLLFRPSCSQLYFLSCREKTCTIQTFPFRYI